MDGDTTRAPSRSPPLPASAVIDEVRIDTAIDHAIDVIDATAAATASAGAAAPGSAHKTRSARGRQPSDSHSTPIRQESNSQPTPSRKRAGGKPKGGKARSGAALSREQLVIGEAVDARDHAAALLDYLFDEVGCRPGDRIAARDMQATYWHHLCPARRWLSLPWGGKNGVGRHLRELCGGRKDHGDLPCSKRKFADGRSDSPVVKTRLYRLPQRDKDEGSGSGAARMGSVTAFPGRRARRAA